MPDATIVVSFATLLQSFSPCFTAPSFESFVTLMSGWVLNLRRHTVTETVRAANHAINRLDPLVSIDLNPLMIVDGRPVAVDALVEVADALPSARSH